MGCRNGTFRLVSGTSYRMQELIFQSERHVVANRRFVIGGAECRKDSTFDESHVVPGNLRDVRVGVNPNEDC